MMISSPKQRTEERGVALLLTLGVLSLLLILTMSFAFTARTELLASEVNADMVKARLLCESGLERVLGFLSFSFDGTEPEDVFPATSGELFTDTNASSGPGSATDWEGRSYMYSTRGTPDQNGIESALATDIGFAFIPQRTNAEITDSDELPDVSWQHLEDSDGDLIGRIAFIVVDESGKLNPTHVTSGSVDEGNEDRIGVSPDEINIGNALGMNDANAQKFRDDMHVNANRWFSWPHIIGRVSSVSSGNAVNDCKAIFPWSYDIEAWWNTDNSKYKHRYDVSSNSGVFDIASETLDTTTTPPTNTLAQGADDFYDANWNSTTPTANSGIPWIGEMKSDMDLDGDGTGGDVGDHDLLRYQVTANMIDYCDENDDPTVDPADPMNTHNVNYCGLEEAPYINEIVFKLVWEDGTDLTMTVDAELVNVYGADYANGSDLDLDIWVDFTDADLDGGNSGNELDDHLFELACTANPISANSYLSTSDADFDNDDNSWTLNQDFDFNIEKVVAVLYNGTTVLDACEIKVDVNAETIVAAPPDPQTLETSIEAKDPRGNTHTSGWKWASATGEPFTDPDNGTLDAGSNDGLNDAWSSVPAPCDDDVADPADGLSTAYIRNNPMEGLWELGCIHRAEPKRTINLKGYADTGRYATFDDDGDGDISDSERGGDGRILDQVKIGDQAEVYGRVNVNSPVQEVWQAMLAGVKLGTAYDDPADASAVDVADVTDLADGVLAVNGGTNGAAFAGRGGIGSVPELTDGTGGTQDTDREQEEIIGKVAHLLTARQNYFNVIVVAQALQDIGGNTSNRSILVTKSDGSDTNVNILAEQKIKAVVYRDAFRNEFEVKRYEFLEN